MELLSITIVYVIASFYVLDCWTLFVKFALFGVIAQLIEIYLDPKFAQTNVCESNRKMIEQLAIVMPLLVVPEEIIFRDYLHKILQSFQFNNHLYIDALFALSHYSHLFVVSKTLAIYRISIVFCMSTMLPRENVIQSSAMHLIYNLAVMMVQILYYKNAVLTEPESESEKCRTLVIARRRNSEPSLSTLTQLSEPKWIPVKVSKKTRKIVDQLDDILRKKQLEKILQIPKT